jgi:glycosyltransferase involved in cell wall biosynthesis
MRVGLIVPGFSADAADWCIPALRHLVQRLSRTDVVEVVALRYPYRAARYELFGARVTALGGGQRRGLGSLQLWATALRTLAAEHHRRPFDLLHAFWANETGALVAVAGRLLRIPTVISLAGGELVACRDIGYGGQLVWSERLKVRLALRFASLVTAGSEALLALARPWLRSRPAGSVRRVPLGVDLELFRPAGAIGAAGRPRVVQVASLSPIKDQRTLLRAAALLRDRGVAFSLALVGSGSEEGALRADLARLALDGVVQMDGEVPHHELPMVYQEAALFALSSRHEAQCLAVLEAAACGLPIVGTRVGVVPELAPDAAQVVEVGDTGGLAEAIGDLLDDPTHLRQMGQAARAAVEAEYSLERCVMRFRELYQALAATGGQPSVEATPGLPGVG